MYRRRSRRREKIVFSFDSFLDVVANVNGIIIRLILVAWVGARAYHGAMTFVDEPIPEVTPDAKEIVKLPAPRVEDEPLTPVLAQQRDQLAEARKRLAEKLGSVDERQKQIDTVAAQLTSLAKSRADLGVVAKQLADQTTREKKDVHAAALSIEELQRRGGQLQQAIAKLEAAPPPKGVLKYHTPVSKTVTSEELFFECLNGRITYLDIAALMHQVEGVFPTMKNRLRDQFQIEETTNPVGAFRLRYTVERHRSAAESMGGLAAPQERIYFGYHMSKFVVEPIVPTRGETVEQALKPTSEFRQTVDALDSQVVVTFWVYPDSFALFRVLRDYLAERGVEVAARPLPMGEPIAGSPHGTRSRGQ
jgi:hypothetical protein